ncbi:sulfatase-like hydrolase/transferase [Stieleria sp. ICT_E10.1]|uniref:sulfatase-like hydrolase/transferase n=1 Tax=Stieleria sedimenti TaxID=2976331 RepID=UPI00217FB6DC|nr:sulfatase-like hydrolase/transferase [Stieleria sedimenti]MCS7469946.1 sulfatase-like hydrolase/transferase [Stieleria sedimenti]
MQTSGIALFAFALLSTLSWGLGHVAQAARPNVILIMSDDQGYGDLGCTGNPIIKTPDIDKLASESSGLRDYHVAPTCSPTRCSLLTSLTTSPRSTA